MLFRHNVLPIAMGARHSDYLRSAPEHSFIHVDQFKVVEIDGYIDRQIGIYRYIDGSIDRKLYI